MQALVSLYAVHYIPMHTHRECCLGLERSDDSQYRPASIWNRLNAFLLEFTRPITHSQRIVGSNTWREGMRNEKTV